MALDAITPTWINAPDAVSAPVYDAETLRRNDSALLTGGATVGTARTGVLDPRGLVVSLSGSNVQVGPGPAAVGTGKGVYLTGASAVGTFGTLTAADGTNPRRDRTMLVILDPDNGGTVGIRKAEFRYIPGTPSPTALSGGGYPAVPTGISGYIDLYDIDVPKSGAGSPTVTDRRPFTAAAGAPIPVRTKAERDALPKWVGLTIQRLDQGGAIEAWDGTYWAAPSTTLNMELLISQSTAATNGGIGAPALLTSSINAAPSHNQDLFSFPGTNQIAATQPGLYSVSWTMKFFSTDGVTPIATSGNLAITNAAGVVEAITPFTAVGDATVDLSNIWLAAGALLNLKYSVSANITANHRARIARTG